MIEYAGLSTMILIYYYLSIIVFVWISKIHVNSKYLLSTILIS